MHFFSPGSHEEKLVETCFYNIFYLFLKSLIFNFGKIYILNREKLHQLPQIIINNTYTLLYELNFFKKYKYKKNKYFYKTMNDLTIIY